MDEILNKPRNVYQMMNDTYKEYLWGLRFINVESAWEQIPKEVLRTIKVAIIDSGIDATHDDLSDELEQGFNFIDNTADTSDDLGHGTRIAGVIGATRNNGIGIAGVASGVRMIPFKVIGSNAKGSIQNVAKALNRAVQMNVDVINLSLGYDRRCIKQLPDNLQYALAAEKEALDQVLKRGIPIISAVGNNSAQPMNFPACYDGIISVASCGVMLDPLQLYPSPKNSKYDSKTLFAPGEFIYTTDKNNSYVYDFGSSMAGAFVSGAVALLKAKKYDLTANEIQKILLKSATIINYKGQQFPFLNVGKAIEFV